MWKKRYSKVLEVMIAGLVIMGICFFGVQSNFFSAPDPLNRRTSVMAETEEIEESSNIENHDIVSEDEIANEEEQITNEDEQNTNEEEQNTNKEDQNTNVEDENTTLDEESLTETETTGSALVVEEEAEVIDADLTEADLMPLEVQSLFLGISNNRYAFSETYAIQTSGDDVGVKATAVNATSTGVYLHGKYTANVDQDNYLRFTGVDLPDDAVIERAYLSFTVRDASTKPTTIKIFGDLGDGGPLPTTVPPYKSKIFTNNYLEMSTPTTIKANQIFDTEDLSAIMNEMRDIHPTLNNYIFKIQGSGVGTAIMRSFNSSAAKAPKLVVEYTSAYGEIHKDITVTKDAAEEYGRSNAIDMGSNMEIGGYWANSLLPEYKNLSAFRIADVQIPKDAEIIDAYLEFTTAGTAPAANISNMVIRAERGNPAQYAAVASNISSRSYGGLSVRCQLPAFTKAGIVIRTPNLKDLIDEKRLEGWESGQALAFTLDGDKFVGSIYKLAANKTPRFIVTYQYSARGAYITDAITDPKKMQNIFINELSSQGTASSKEDWLELYNNNDVPIILGAGVYLSKDEKKPTQYEFQNLVIPAKGFRVLYCDENPNLGVNHTNFTLKNTTGTVYLNSLNDSNKVSNIDQITYPEHNYNQTYGRAQDGGSDMTIFQKESFEKSNVTGQQNYKVALSHDRGVYDSGFSLTISQSNPNATIKYSIDGVTTPSETAGTTYLTPIQINKSCVLKLYVYDKEGNSGLQTYTYVLKNNLVNETISGSVWQYKTNITSQDYAQALASLPIVSVTTDTGKALVPNQDYVNTTFEYIDAHLNNGNHNTFSSSGAKKFGQASMSWPNGNVTLKFHRDFLVKKIEQKIFDPIPGDAFPTPGKYSHLQLKEGEDGPQTDIWDVGYLRYDDKVTHTLATQMGKFDVKTRYVNYFFNGKYAGVKTLREDFDDSTFENYFGDDSSNYTEINFQDGYFPSGTVSSGSAQLLKDINKTVTDKNFQEFKKYVDINDMIKLQILFMFTDTEREVKAMIFNNAYSGKGVKLMSYINDTDGAFFNDNKTGTTSAAFVGGGGTYRYKWGDSTSRKGFGGWFGAFSGDSKTSVTAGNLEFKTLVKDQVLQQIGPVDAALKGATGAPLSVANVQTILTDNFNELNQSQAYKVDAAYMGARKTIYTDWLNMQVKVQNQVLDRVSYSLQMWKTYGLAHTLQPVTLTKVTGGVTFVSPDNATIYYTLDGSDPMGANGVVSTNAKVYTKGQTVVSSKNLIIRPFATNNWGPKTQGN